MADQVKEKPAVSPAEKARQREHWAEHMREQASKTGLPERVALQWGWASDVFHRVRKHKQGDEAYPSRADIARARDEFTRASILRDPEAVAALDALKDDEVQKFFMDYRAKLRPTPNGGSRMGRGDEP